MSSTSGWCVASDEHFSASAMGIYFSKPKMGSKWRATRLGVELHGQVHLSSPGPSDVDMDILLL